MTVRYEFFIYLICLMVIRLKRIFKSNDTRKNFFHSCVSTDLGARVQRRSVKTNDSISHERK